MVEACAAGTGGTRRPVVVSVRASRRAWVAAASASSSKREGGEGFPLLQLQKNAETPLLKRDGALGGYATDTVVRGAVLGGGAAQLRPLLYDDGGGRALTGRFCIFPEARKCRF